MADRSTLKVHPERSAANELGAILSAGVVAHVGLVNARGPVVIPMIYHYDSAGPNTIYLHGAPHSSLMRAAGEGVPMCVTITRLDGLVYSRTALYHSVNYRSAVCFGRVRVVRDDERGRVLDAIIRRYFPARLAGRDYDPMPNAHEQATVVVAMTIEDASAKVRAAAQRGRATTTPVRAEQQE